MRLIDADALEARMGGLCDEFGTDHLFIDAIVYEIGNAPTVDAVSRGVHEQVRWERDVAIEQLESYGVSLGEKAEVAKVVHGRWDKYEDDKFIGYDANGRIQYRKVYTYYCGRCGRGTAVKTNYCPNCGADMRERRDK